MLIWLVELRGIEPLTSAVRLPQKVQKKAARILGQKKRRLDMLAIHPVTRDKRRSGTANFCARVPLVGALPVKPSTILTGAQGCKSVDTFVDTSDLTAYLSS
jgi:hypothetical protein